MEKDNIGDLKFGVIFTKNYFSDNLIVLIPTSISFGTINFVNSDSKIALFNDYITNQAYGNVECMMLDEEINGYEKVISYSDMIKQYGTSDLKTIIPSFWNDIRKNAYYYDFNESVNFQ